MGNCKDNHDRGIRSAGMNKRRYGKKTRSSHEQHTGNTQLSPTYNSKRKSVDWEKNPA